MYEFSSTLRLVLRTFQLLCQNLAHTRTVQSGIIKVGAVTCSRGDISWKSAETADGLKFCWAELRRNCIAVITGDSLSYISGPPRPSLDLPVVIRRWPHNSLPRADPPLHKSRHWPGRQAQRSPPSVDHSQDRQRKIITLHVSSWTLSD